MNSVDGNGTTEVVKPDSEEDAPAAREFEICPIDSLPPGKHMIATVGNRQIGIFNIKGSYFALPNICPHQTGPACEGKKTTGSLRAGKETSWSPEWIFDGEVMVCPWHGLEYHIPTGSCLAYPNIRLRRYHIFTRNEKIMIRL